MATRGDAAGAAAGEGEGRSGARYSVLVPTYNESDNLPLLVSMVFKSLEGVEGVGSVEMVIVEDNSPDGTYFLARRLQSVFGGEDRVKILRRAGKMGLGSAYVDGLNLCTGDFIFIMDADLSHHPKFMPAFVRRQREGDYDVVTGTRYRWNGGVTGWDLRRKLTSRVANFIAATILSPPVSDVTGSFRLYKREVLKNLIENEVKSRGYVFQMEIIVRAGALGYNIAEVPIFFVDRLYGTSKLGATEIVSYLHGIWQIFWDI